jgi:ATP-dependent RNA helicase DHX8/PRP22
LLTSKEYMHCVTSIDAKWLPWAAPTFFSFADTSKLSKEKKSKKIVPLYDRYAQDQDSWRLSSARRMPEKDANIFG